MVEEKVSSYDFTTGVIVTVTQRQKNYTVEVSIPRTAIRNNRIFVKNHDFKMEINFRSVDSNQDFYEFKFTKKYSFVRFGFIRNCVSYNEVKGTNYQGTLILFSRFYVDDERRASKPKIRKEAGKMRGLRSTGPSGERGMNGSKYTNYEHNNAHKPFEGGLVQPK